MKHDNDAAIQEHTQRALNRSVTDLPPATQQRLHEARQRALSPSRKAWHWQPMVAMACSLCAVALLWWQIPSVSTPEDPTLFTHHNEEAIDAFTYLTTLDETEQEIVADLEFALWLSLQSDAELDDDVSKRG